MKEGIITNFQEEKNSLGGILVAYIKKNYNHSSTKNQKNLINDIIDATGIDTKVWKPEFFKITPNAWSVTAKMKETSVMWLEQAYNFQLKVEIRFVRIAPTNYNEFKEELLAELRRKSPRRKEFKSPLSDGSALLVDLPDRHFGRLAYGKETGDNYDIKIAADRSLKAIDYFLDEAKYMHSRHPIEKIYYAIGNDFFNYNHAKPFPQTSNGTPQESDVRYQKMFYIGSSIEIKQIEASAEIAPVEVFVIPGNHDEEIAFYLGQVLQAWFKNNKRVSVNISPTPRKYKQHGLNMLGFDHGQYVTFERLFANMSFEDMKMWADTKFKYMFTGHLHHKDVKIRFSQSFKQIVDPKTPTLVTEDLNGVMFDRLASLSSNDYYEAIKGFIHIKMAEAFLFDKELGKRTSFIYQLPLSIHSANQ